MAHALGDYMVIEKLPRGIGKKTDRWEIMSSHSGANLGFVAWYGPWRQYVFDPCGGTTFNTRCLQDIAQFLTQANAKHRAKEQ